jgi:hypothetical protein
LCPFCNGSGHSPAELERLTAFLAGDDNRLLDLFCEKITEQALHLGLRHGTAILLRIAICILEQLDHVQLTEWAFANSPVGFCEVCEQPGDWDTDLILCPRHLTTSSLDDAIIFLNSNAYDNLDSVNTMLNRYHLEATTMGTYVQTLGQIPLPARPEGQFITDISLYSALDRALAIFAATLETHVDEDSPLHPAPTFRAFIREIQRVEKGILLRIRDDVIRCLLDDPPRLRRRNADKDIRSLERGAQGGDRSDRLRYIMAKVRAGGIPETPHEFADFLRVLPRKIYSGLEIHPVLNRVYSTWLPHLMTQAITNQLESETDDGQEARIISNIIVEFQTRPTVHAKPVTGYALKLSTTYSADDENHGGQIADDIDLNHRLHDLENEWSQIPYLEEYDYHIDLENDEWSFNREWTSDDEEEILEMPYELAALQDADELPGEMTITAIQALGVHHLLAFFMENNVDVDDLIPLSMPCADCQEHDGWPECRICTNGVVWPHSNDPHRAYIP